MSAKITVPFVWADIDADKLARDWIQDDVGTHREMGTKASAVATLADAFNHLAARQAPVVFDQIQLPETADQTGKVPLYDWRGPRRVDNARTYVVRIITQPRTLDSNADAYAERMSTAVGEQTPPSNVGVASLNPYYDVRLEEYETAERGSPADLATDGISTYAGYTILDVVAQAPGLSKLTVGTHLYADPFSAKPEGQILASSLPDVAHAFHRLRTTQLARVMSWAAVGVTATPTSPGDHTCLAVNSAARVNLFDQAFNTRTATSPGATFYCYRGGVGREDQPPGLRIPISCRVFANATYDTNVCFQGPEHVVPNSINVLVPAGGAPAWHEAAGVIWGNPAAHENTTSVNRNKVDAFSEGVASGVLRVYGVQCDMNDPMPYA